MASLPPLPQGIYTSKFKCHPMKIVLPERQNLIRNCSIPTVIIENGPKTLSPKVKPMETFEEPPQIESPRVKDEADFDIEIQPERDDYASQPNCFPERSLIIRRSNSIPLHHTAPIRFPKPTFIHNQNDDLNEELQQAKERLHLVNEKCKNKVQQVQEHCRQRILALIAEHKRQLGPSSDAPELLELTSFNRAKVCGEVQCYQDVKNRDIIEQQKQELSDLNEKCNELIFQAKSQAEEELRPYQARVAELCQLITGKPMDVIVSDVEYQDRYQKYIQPPMLRRPSSKPLLRLTTII